MVVPRCQVGAWEVLIGRAWQVLAELRVRPLVRVQGWARVQVRLSVKSAAGTFLHESTEGLMKGVVANLLSSSCTHLHRAREVPGASKIQNSALPSHPQRQPRLPHSCPPSGGLHSGFGGAPVGGGSMGSTMGGIASAPPGTCCASMMQPHPAHHYLNNYSGNRHIFYFFFLQR